MRAESYISLTIRSNTITMIAKREEEARKLVELLKRFGIEAISVSGSRCG